MPTRHSDPKGGWQDAEVPCLPSDEHVESKSLVAGKCLKTCQGDGGYVSCSDSFKQKLLKLNP